MYKKGALLLTIMILTLMLSACSYKKLEDSAREKVETMKDEIVKSQNDDTEKKPTPEEGVSGIGDTIVYSNGLDFTVEYTLDAVRVGKTLDEVGLSREEFSTPEKIAEDGTPNKDAVAILGKNGYEGVESLFVVATVTVKNVDWDANTFPLMIESFAGIEEAFDENSPASMQEIQYFSAHSQDKKDYTKFTLEPGNEMRVEVGWIVPKIYQDKPYYYEIGSMSRSSGRAQYFQMDISGESDK